MKVFVTGASGFIGTAVVQELLSAGHKVTGLARSEESAQKISAAGASAVRGSLEDVELLKKAASEADGIIHLAFFHDFTQYALAAQLDKQAIETFGEALRGTGKPLVVTAGLLGLRMDGQTATEADAAPPVPRASEATALAQVEKGIRVSVIRLAPSVHDKGDGGFVPFIISRAKATGISAFVGDGQNRWTGVHRLDAAQLFRLALEKGKAGARYNATGDEGIPIKTIATTIGEELNLPVKSISQEDAAAHFQWMSRFIAFDSPASSLQTQQELGWKPTHIGLLEDMRQNYF